MEIVERSAQDLARAIAARDLSCAEVMAAFLDRIEAVNPGLNAIVALRDRDALMAEARAADAGPVRGALHGLPTAPKDMVATQGIVTTWGSPIHRDTVPAKDDIIAARMRGAGAIFIGKTNVPEWGQGSHTFNPVYGVTRNPYDPARSAGGSSGGAAAALAARMLPVADGSDMMGSLRNPAAFCNVYGFRPTWGLVPGGVLGEAFLGTLATEGPMARSPADLAVLLEVIAGPDPRVPFGRSAEPYRSLLETDLRGMRIGWLADWGGAYPMEPGILATCEEALAVLEGLGARVEPLAAPFPAADLWRSWTTLRAMLNAGGKVALAEDPALRAQTKPETLWEIAQGTGLSAEAVYRASLTRSRWYRRAAELFATHDALVLPSAQVWSFPAEWRWPETVAGRAMDTYHRWMEVVVPASLAGLPALAVPAGFGPAGLPTGMQIIGPAGSDARILALGQAYHRATDWPGRRPPRLPAQLSPSSV